MSSEELKCSALNHLKKVFADHSSSSWMHMCDAAIDRVQSLKLFLLEPVLFSAKGLLCYVVSNTEK